MLYKKYLIFTGLGELIDFKIYLTNKKIKMARDHNRTSAWTSACSVCKINKGRCGLLIYRPKDNNWTTLTNICIIYRMKYVL
jgi:hypothetical protein